MQAAPIGWRLTLSVSASASGSPSAKPVPHCYFLKPKFPLPQLGCQSYSNWNAYTGPARLGFRFCKLPFTHKQLKFWPDFRFGLKFLSQEWSSNNPYPFFWTQNQQVNCILAVIQIGFSNWPPRGQYAIQCLVSHCLIDFWMGNGHAFGPRMREALNFLQELVYLKWSWPFFVWKIFHILFLETVFWTIFA